MDYFKNIEDVDSQIVDNNWVEWIHYAIPNRPKMLREVYRVLAVLLGHCLNCTALSGCYFVKSKLPRSGDDDQNFTHIRCHCKIVDINKPYGEVDAYCPIEKFTKYIFSEKGEKNGKKKLFEKWGFSCDDSYFLKVEYENQARQKYLNGDYILNSLDKYGQNINIVISLKNKNKDEISVISGWKVNPEGYITCNTPYGDRWWKNTM